MDFDDFSGNDFSDEENDISDNNDIEENGTDLNDENNFSDESERIDSLTEYQESLEYQTQERTDFQHWNNEYEEINNQMQVDYYGDKLHAANMASIQTKYDILQEYRDSIASDTVERLNQNGVQNNQIEIYSTNFFAEKIGNQNGIVGSHDLDKGIIAIRNAEKIEEIQDTSVHETIHDLAYNQQSEVVNEYEMQGKQAKDQTEKYQSGVFHLEITERFLDGNKIDVTGKESGRALNEGITQSYTIDQIQKSRREPSFESYTNEVMWANQLRDTLGEKVVANAYFGGKSSELKEAVDDRAGKGAYDNLISNIDYISENEMIDDDEIQNKVGTARQEIVSILTRLDVQ